MVKYSNICNYVHLPLQAGSNRVLKLMNRNYTKEEFLDLVDLIRTHMPDCSISTDIIVGFPGETDDEFRETLEIVDKVRFDFAYMFKYSSRPGTKAAEYTNQIDEETKQNRLAELIEIQNSIRLEVNKERVGSVQKVLIEKESKKSKEFWSGRTDGNVWTILKKGSESVGDIVDVVITDAQGVTLFGENINYKGEIS